MKKCILPLFMLCFLVFGCTEQPSIRPPFSNVKLPVEEITFMAESGYRMVLDNGGEIVVPANAFIDKEANIVKGEVTLMYKEIQDVAGLLVSGIPLKFGEDKDPKIMESAIMFELRAYQKDQELLLVSDKSIATSIASNVEGEEFKLYSFDQRLGNWEYEASVKPVANPVIDSLNRNITTGQSSLKAMDLSHCFILNYFDELDVAFEADQPKLKDPTFNYYTWDTFPGFDTMMELMKAKIEQYGGFFMDTKGYQQVFFEGKKYNPNMVLWEPSQPLPDWLKKTSLYYTTEMKPAGNGAFYLTFYKLNRENWDKVKLYTAKANIKMPLAQLYKQAPQSRSATYDSLVNIMEQERQLLQAQNRVLRSFNIRQMGIYNYDIIKNEDRLMVNARVISESSEEVSRKSDLFVILKNQNTVIRYSDSQLDQFAAYPKMEFMAFTVSIDNKISLQKTKTLSENEWQSLQGGKPLDIVLSPTQYEITTLDDVSAFLNLENSMQAISLAVRN